MLARETMEKLKRPRLPGAEPAVEGPGRLHALTGLRFFAALAVYLHHVPRPPQLPRPFQTFIEAGYMGVTLFFTLSGFVLTITYFDGLSRPSRHGVWRYAVARFARVYPLYLLILACIIVKMRLHGDTTHAWLEHVLALQAWDPRESIAIGYNGPAWSISVEFFLYACFPLIAIAFARVRSLRGLAIAGFLVLMAMALVTLAVGQIPIANSGYWLYRTPLTRLGDFLLGVLVARAYLELRHKPTSVQIGAALAITGSVALIGLMIWPPLTHSLWGLDLAYVLPSIAIIFGLAIAPRSPLGRTFSLPAIVFLGEASYALYLCHKEMLGHFGSTAWVTDITPVNVLWQVFAFTIILGMAIALHLLVERPARTRIRRLRNPLLLATKSA